MIKWLMLFLTTFLLIFGWKVSNYLDISASLGLIIAFYPFLSDKNLIKSLIKSRGIKDYKWSVIPLILLSIHSSTIVFINGITHLTTVLRVVRALVILLATISLYNLYDKRYDNPERKLCTHIFFSLVLHGAIMLAMYLSRDFCQALYSMTKALDYININSPVLDGLRICGLTYGLAQTSVLQSFAIILLPYILEKNESRKIKISAIISIPILIISMLISGRTALVISPLLIIAYFSLKFMLLKKSKDFWLKRAAKLLAYIGITAIFTLAALQTLPSKFKNYTLRSYKGVFEAFQLKGAVFTTLAGMYFLPEDLTTTLFGSGNYGRSEGHYIKSDVGWIRSIFAVGVLGSITMSIPFLWGINAAFKLKSESVELRIAIILILLATMILNFKEVALLTRNQWTIEAILLTILANKTKTGPDQR